MKKYLFFAALIAAATVFSCAKENGIKDNTDSAEEGVYVYTLSASMELLSDEAAPQNPEEQNQKDLKATISNSGVFSWEVGDEIAVFDSEGDVYVFKTSASGPSVTFTTTSSVSGLDFSGCKAYYPAGIVSKAGGDSQITLPDSYSSLDEASRAFPMVGVVSSDGSIAFKHLAALVKLTINDVPSDVKVISFDAKVPVNGTFSVDTTNPSSPALTSVSGTNSVSVSIASSGSVIAYIPVPAASYDGFTVSFLNSGKDYWYFQKSTDKTKSINRATVFGMLSFYYYVDSIKEWYLVSDLNGWDTTAKNMRLIKTAQDTYSISTYVYTSNHWYYFHDGVSQFGVASASSGTLVSGVTCSRSGNDELFKATLTENGSNWVLSDSGYGTDWDRVYPLSSTVVCLKSDLNNWDNSCSFTKTDHNNNLAWYYQGLVVPDNATYAFKFYVSGDNGSWEWWIGGNSVSVTNGVPYATAASDNGGNMYFTLTKGTYNVYIDIKTLNFMFVKQ